MKKITEIKSITELEAELAGIAAKVEACAINYNEASMNDEFKIMAEQDTLMKDLEKEYADVSQRLTFTVLKEKENPMFEAIKAHSFPVMKHKDTSESGSTIKTRNVEIVERQFDLRDFDLFCGGKITADNKCWSMAERFNMLCAIHVANDLKVADLSAIGTSYFLSKTKEEIKIAGENDNVANPISNTQMLKMLQKILDGIIYEENGKGANQYKAKSQDVAWLLFTYGRKDSKGRLTLKLADHKNFRKILADVLHRIVTDTDYRVAYKEMKK